MTAATYTAIYQQQSAPVDVAALERDQVTLGNRSVYLRKAAVATGIASLVAFIVGAIISGSVLVYFRP
jgi:hypothetical protein